MHVMNVFRKLLCKVLLMHLFPLVSQTFAQVNSNMINIMAASKATTARMVLMFSSSDTERIYPRVNQLPTAVKFAPVTPSDIGCEFSCHYREQECGISKEECYEFSFLPRIVYLPFFSTIPQLQQGWIKGLSRYRSVQFIISSEVHDETVRHFSQHTLCDVVSVSSRDINAPADRYRRCGQRVNVTASSLFASDAASGNKFPKGQEYTAAVHYPDGSKGDIDTKPEVLAMKDALIALNNTVNVTEVVGSVAVTKKSVDIVLLPITTAFLEDKRLFADAYYSPERYCFFTRRRIDIHMAFVVSSMSFVEFLIALIFVGTLVALCVHTRSRVLFRAGRLLTLPGFVLFMVGTFFGRCHIIPVQQAPSYRSLAVVSWMIGMLFLGNYVQTSITAIRALPSVSAAVRTLEELKPHIQTCAMSPCFNDVWIGILSSNLIPGAAPIFPGLLKWMADCREMYCAAGDISPCYAKAQAGSHVVLSTCSDEDVSATSQWGLVASDDLFTFPQMLAIHWQNPDRYKFRRILFAIAEHGLAVPHRRRVLPQKTEQYGEAESFDLYFSVYLAGCALSCAALAAELLCRLKHRQKVGSIRQPLLLTTVSG